MDFTFQQYEEAPRPSRARLGGFAPSGYDLGRLQPGPEAVTVGRSLIFKSSAPGHSAGWSSGTGLAPGRAHRRQGDHHR